MEEFTTYGHVNKNGKLKIYNLDIWQNKIESFASTSIELRIREKPTQVNDKFRAYYFAVVVPQMQQAYEHAGWKFTRTDIDEYLRSKFLFVEVLDEMEQKYVRKNRSLKKFPHGDVTPKQMTQFVDDCIQLAAERFSWEIPYPNEKIENE